MTQTSEPSHESERKVATSVAATAATKVTSVRPILKRMILGLIVTLLLMVGNKYLEQTAVGKKVETITFEYLQRMLPSFGEEMPIVVVDMNKIPGNRDEPTSRAALREALAAIVAQKPTAVGIDVDFSPGVSGWQVDDDPLFFDFCLQLQQTSGVPIFLGVYRTIGENSDTWLGSGKYKKLAAALRTEDDTMRLPRWLQANDSDERLPLMSAALAESYQLGHADPARSLSRTVEIVTSNPRGIERRGEDKMLLGLSLVNYSRLEQIRRETQLTIMPSSIAESGRRFAGKIVILGDAGESPDLFKVPGHDELVPGVYVIACAAYSLAVEPLYELNSAARLVLDLAISILIMLRVEWLRSRYVKKRAGSRFYEKQSRSIWVALAAVVVVGLLMTWFLHIMWFDFPLAGFALLLHPKVEHSFSNFLRKLRAPNKQRRK